jgi:hypothetical protein
MIGYTRDSMGLDRDTRVKEEMKGTEVWRKSSKVQ